ncbi:PREDICTED: mucin-17-like, partial [Galeopterus variegatus]|uniref:Mucin-17-like n=1 Tax=Galeopterus variegatus TaxID=482537 RepID=A0ABM0S4B1_GALVR
LTENRTVWDGGGCSTEDECLRQTRTWDGEMSTSSVILGDVASTGTTAAEVSTSSLTLSDSATSGTTTADTRTSSLTPSDTATPATTTAESSTSSATPSDTAIPGITTTDVSTSSETHNDTAFLGTTTTDSSTSSATPSDTQGSTTALTSTVTAIPGTTTPDTTTSSVPAGDTSTPGTTTAEATTSSVPPGDTSAPGTTTPEGSTTSGTSKATTSSATPSENANRGPTTTKASTSSVTRSDSAIPGKTTTEATMSSITSSRNTSSGITTAKATTPSSSTPDATRPVSSSIPTTPSSTASSAASTAGPCQNGGTWDGLKCQCPTQFYGKSCEKVYPIIDIGQPPKTVSALVNLTVTVTSEVYTIALQNRSSEEFQKFNETFTKQMNIAYHGIPEYDGVNIVSLTEGSVVVEHTVFLSTNYTPEFKEVLDKAAQKVIENITYVTRVQIGDVYTCKDIMCFNVSATEVLNVVIDYDPEEECKKLAGQYADYFFVEYKDGNPYCISSCASDFTTSMDCNAGECMVELSGPRCYCLTSDTHWYSGETCQWSIRKTLLYGLLGAAAGVLLIILAILLVFACRSRRQRERQKSKVSHLYQWHEEGSGPTPRTFQNVGFDIGEEHRGSVHPDSIYSNFQPSLSHIDHEKKTEIQRPQVFLTAL